MTGPDRKLLTQRQTEVLRFLDIGLRPAEIADRLCLSEATVRMHIRDAIARLDVSGYVAALHAARQRGLLG